MYKIQSELKECNTGREMYEMKWKVRVIARDKQKNLDFDLLSENKSI